MLYRPLETETTIRLLDIHPGKPSDLVVCSLRHCNLETQPEAYEAISYVWGEAVSTESIICDDQDVRITPSLYQVLERVRLPDKTRTVWADSLCIHQQDNAEKSHQVQFMARTYAHARQVLVWLGAAAPDVASRGFSFCRSIGHHPGMEPEDVSVLLKAVSGITQDDPRWMPLIELSSRPWWTRLWIVQELVLAPRAVMLWGPEDIDWTTLDHAISKVRRIDSSLALFVFTSATFDSIARLSVLKRNAKLGKDLVSTVKLGRPLACTNDRDRVYGLLGLLADQSVADSIKPDYGKSVEEVYWDFAILACHKNLADRLFMCIQHDGRILAPWRPGMLPTWVPRWNVHYASECITSIHIESITALHHAFGKARLSSSREVASAADEAPMAGPRADTLLIAGAVIDHIVEVSDFMCDAESSCAFESLVLFWTDHIEGGIARYSERDQLSAFCETVTCHLPFQLDVSVIASYLKHEIDARDENKAPSDLVKKAQIMLQALKLHTEEETERGRPSDISHAVQALQSFFRTSFHYSRLFLTGKGYIGEGPAATRRGDVVTLLCDVAAPVLARRQDSFLRVVGASSILALISDSTHSPAFILRDSPVQMLDFR
jgi:hypothetical protein